MFRRVLLPSLLAVLPLAALVGSRPVVAVTVHAVAPAAQASLPAAVTNDQLAAAALTSDDVPDYPASVDLSPAPPNGFAAMFVRAFLSPDGGGSGVIDGLFVTDLPLPPSLIVSLFSDGSLAQALSGSGASAQNFQTAGSLGIGDADVQMSWDQTAGTSDAILHVEADIFAQGPVIALVMLISPANASQPALMQQYARAQAARLAAAGLSR